MLSMTYRWLVLGAMTALMPACGGPTKRAAAAPAPIEARTRVITKSAASEGRPLNTAGNANAEASPPSPYAALRAAHQTVLPWRGPAPQPCSVGAPPAGVQEVHYPSAGRSLRAWYAAPVDIKPGETRGAVVFFHGGFAFDEEDWATADRFLDAGYVVLAPMLRGECGNPGDFEEFYGEVDDGRAAIAWLRTQAPVDSHRVFAIGHSAGGRIAAFVSMYDDSGIRLGASIAGMYDRPLGALPFDGADPLENALRCPGLHGESIRIPHVAYVGDGEPLVRAGARRAAAAAAVDHRALTVVVVSGNHFTSLEPAIDDFLGRIARTP